MTRPSPFDDPATIERVVAILRRGWERHVAQQDAEPSPSTSTGGEAR